MTAVRVMRQYTDAEQQRVILYGTCPKLACRGARDTRLIDLGNGDKRLEMYCPDCCPCPCSCPAPCQRDDDGTPGWCDPCRMNIHQEA